MEIEATKESNSSAKINIFRWLGSWLYKVLLSIFLAYVWTVFSGHTINLMNNIEGNKILPFLLGTLLFLLFFELARILSKDAPKIHRIVMYVVFITSTALFTLL